MEAFEKEFLDMILNIKFRSVKETFQKKLKKHIPKRKQSPNAFFFVDKTSNIYEIPKQQHKNLLHNNFTKTYKKAPPKLETSINLEAKTIADLINLDDRIDCIARTPTFITLKEYKPDFQQNPLCRLINPAKNELGKVRKLIIEKINEKLISELHSTNGRIPIQFRNGLLTFLINRISHLFNLTSRNSTHSSLKIF